MPAAAGDSCPPSRELAEPGPGAWGPRPVAIYAWNLETCSLPKAPRVAEACKAVNYLCVHWARVAAARATACSVPVREDGAPWCPAEREVAVREEASSERRASVGAGGWTFRWAAGEGLQAAGSWAGWRDGYPGRSGAVQGSALSQP